MLKVRLLQYNILTLSITTAAFLYSFGTESAGTDRSCRNKLSGRAKEKKAYSHLFFYISCNAIGKNVFSVKILAAVITVVEEKKQEQNYKEQYCAIVKTEISASSF